MARGKPYRLCPAYPALPCPALPCLPLKKVRMSPGLEGFKSPPGRGGPCGGGSGCGWRTAPRHQRERWDGVRQACWLLLFSTETEPYYFLLTTYCTCYILYLVRVDERVPQQGG
jgi:hypothetical protein